MYYAIVIWPITVLATVAGWWLVRRFLQSYAFDDEYAAMIPGASAREGRGAKSRVRRHDVPVAVAFHPPSGVRAAELGTLIHRDAHTKEYLATLVDLAMRGYLTMAPTDDGDHVFEATDKPRGDLLGFEHALLREIFSRAPRVTQRQLEQPEYRAAYMSLSSALKQRVMTLGWFKRRAAMLVVGGLGIVVAMAGAGIVEWGLIELFVNQAGWWWPLGLPAMFMGLQMLFALGKCTARTAEGSAILAQAKGFELYLATAEQGQLRFEEKHDLFSRYLPYAIVFGLVDQWEKKANNFRKAEERSVRGSRLTWQESNWRVFEPVKWRSRSKDVSGDSADRGTTTGPRK